MALAISCPDDNGKHICFKLRLRVTKNIKRKGFDLCSGYISVTLGSKQIQNAHAESRCCYRVSNKFSIDMRVSIISTSLFLICNNGIGLRYSRRGARGGSKYQASDWRVSMADQMYIEHNLCSDVSLKHSNLSIGILHVGLKISYSLNS